MDVHNCWRKVLGLPPWTKLSHLYQPLHRGGPGRPNLEVRPPPPPATPSYIKGQVILAP